jgi:broad specificity phosphatase PhoE
MPTVKSCPPPGTGVQLNAPDSAPTDDALARAMRQQAQALIDALPAKIEAAPLNQAAAALKTLVDLIKVLEADDSTHAQAHNAPVIRWEFAYDGAVHAAPPWADGRDAPSGPVPGGGVRPAVGQNGAGQGGAA